MIHSDLKEFRELAYRYLLDCEKPLATPAIARRLFGARRHEMPETQVVVRALLGSDPCFVKTHDNCWSVLGSPALNHSLAEATFSVVDLETTGSVIGVDEIIEVGLVQVRGGEIVNSYETMVWTDRTIPPWVARLTGIRNSQLEGAPTFSDVAEEIYQLLDGTVFVAHDIRFDLPFLRWEFARRGLGRPATTGLCTLQLSRDVWPDLTSRNLADLSRHFGISHDNPHRAADDAKAAAGVLLAALDVADTLGLTELSDLFRFGELAKALVDVEEPLSEKTAES